MKESMMSIFLDKLFSRGKDKTTATVSPPTTPGTSHKLTPADIPAIEPEISDSLAEQLRTEIAKDAAFFYVFETGDAATAPAGMICSSHAGEKGETGYVRLANGSPDAVPAGETGGYSIRLPDEVEAAASGHHVVVRIIARAVGNDQSRFAVSYSTNEVGNSGWNWFNTGTEWSIHTMEYDVAVMVNGNSDFVGILVDEEDHPGTEFCYLAITIS